LQVFCIPAFLQKLYHALPRVNVGDVVRSYEAAVAHGRNRDGGAAGPEGNPD